MYFTQRCCQAAISYACLHPLLCAGFMGASPNCAAGSGTFAAAANGCQACAPGTASPGGAAACQPCAAGTAAPAGSATCQPCAAGTAAPAGSASCSLCPGNTYAAQGAAACTPCAPRSASLPGSTNVGECIANTCSIYLIPASSLAGAFERDCPASTPQYECLSTPCTAGFTFLDISDPSVCTTQTIASITVEVTMGLNCNPTSYSAPAMLNGIALSSASFLDTGPYSCGCGAPATSEVATIVAADVETGGYDIQGTNEIIFAAFENIAYYAYSDDAYAKITVNL